MGVDSPKSAERGCAGRESTRFGARRNRSPPWPTTVPSTAGRYEASGLPERAGPGPCRRLAPRHPYARKCWAFSVTQDEQVRRERAAKRAKLIVLHKGRLGQPEVDFTPICGAAAFSLTTRLTMESFSLARLDSVGGSRRELPVWFVPRIRA